MPKQWARCCECSGEVWFDSWVTLSGEMVHAFDDSHCDTCEGPVGYGGWEAVDGDGPPDDWEPVPPDEREEDWVPPHLRKKETNEN